MASLLVALADSRLKRTGPSKGFLSESKIRTATLPVGGSLSVFVPVSPGSMLAIGPSLSTRSNITRLGPLRRPQRRSVAETVAVFGGRSAPKGCRLKWSELLYDQGDVGNRSPVRADGAQSKTLTSSSQVGARCRARGVRAAAFDLDGFRLGDFACRFCVVFEANGGGRRGTVRTRRASQNPYNDAGDSQ